MFSTFFIYVIGPTIICRLVGSLEHSLDLVWCRLLVASLDWSAAFNFCCQVVLDCFHRTMNSECNIVSFSPHNGTDCSVVRKYLNKKGGTSKSRRMGGVRESKTVSDGLGDHWDWGRCDRRVPGDVGMGGNLIRGSHEQFQNRSPCC